MKKNKKFKNVFVKIILFLIVCVIVVLGVYFFMPNLRQVPLYSYFNHLREDREYIVVEDKEIELLNYPVKKDSELYIPVDFVKEYIDEYIYWDNVVKKLTITTPTKVMRMNPNELDYQVNEKSLKLNLPVYEIENIAYMPATLLVELYNINIDYQEKYKRAIIDYKDKEKQLGQSDGKSNVRYEDNIKSPIAQKLIGNEKLVIYESGEEFTKVRTEEGIIGYLDNKKVIKTLLEKPVIVREEETKPKTNIKGKINLVWDAIYEPIANTNESKKIEHVGVNVLAPTWFEFDMDEKNGTLINIADKSYVDWAHASGYKVWALLTDNFNKDVGLEILSNTEYREYIIRQLLAFADIYGFDGLNIDFESITEDAVPYYLQFLRELSPVLKEKDLILSVDMYVPLYTKYYNRTEVGKVADYICVMTYDEHTGSDKGPVASYDFVNQGIIDTMREVPREKIIMGIPFYSRIWRNGIRFAEYGRNTTMSTFKENGGEFEWQEDVKTYYSYYTKTEGEEEVLYEVWLEDERSMAEKLRVFKEYDLAGVASWARGLGHDAFYEVISENLKEMESK